MANAQSFLRAPGLWRRFVRRRSALAGFVLLGLFLLATLVTLPFAVRWYNAQELTKAVRHAPALSPAVSLSEVKSHAAPARDAPTDRLTRWAWGLTSWMGHDNLGRSLFYRVMPATLVSLAVGLCAALTAMVLGTVWGAIAAYAGGAIDQAMMRVVDVLYGLPYLLMVILLKTALTAPLTSLLAGHARAANMLILFIAIGGVSWLTMARVVRGQVLALREQPFVDAARAAGARPVYILFRHVLPNLIGPIVVYATLIIPQAILQESFLSFLGIGVQQPTPSLGQLAADGLNALNTFVGYWWMLVFPCAALVLLLVALNFIGDGLRDALDPRSSTVAW